MLPVEMLPVEMLPVGGALGQVEQIAANRRHPFPAVQSIRSKADRKEDWMEVELPEETGAAANEVRQVRPDAGRWLPDRSEAGARECRFDCFLRHPKFHW